MDQQGQPAKYGGDWSGKLGQRVGPDSEGMCWEVTLAEYEEHSNVTMVAFTPIPKDVLTYGEHAIGSHEHEFRLIPPLCGPHNRHRSEA